MPNDDAKSKHYSHFSNKACEYYPCHAGADPEDFNCLFCYCPLYALGDQCGGSFIYLETGFKDCSHCLFPHRLNNYEKVLERYSKLVALVRRETASE